MSNGRANVPSLMMNYGAFELKRTYQRNMMIAVGWVTLACVVIMGTYLGVQWYQDWQRNQLGNAPRVRVISSVAELDAPPSMTAAPPQIQVAQPKVAPPSIGIPTPVPDEEVMEEVQFATRDELAELAAPVVTHGGGGDSVVVDIDVGEYFPEIGEFVAVEQQPVPIQKEKPIYPDMARLAEMEGDVWVWALIDTDGRVQDVVIQKPSGSNAGFEEAAIEAAKKSRFKPAIQNGQPVRVWVSYKIEFRLTN